jgi:hypothetical protein
MAMAGLSRAGRRYIAAAALACAVIAIPVAALAASAAPGAAPAHGAVTVPYCHPAGQGGAFVWLGEPSNGFAGGVVYQLEVSNTGRSACTLHGVPRLGAVLPSGRLIDGRTTAGSGNGPLVRLRPGATAHIILVVHDAGALCEHAVSANVIVYLPGQRRAQPAWLTVRACRGRPGGGVLSAGPVRAGTGIPLFTTR